MKRFGMRRLARYGSLAAVLGVVATVIAIAASTALAVPSTKLYVTSFAPKFAAAGSTSGYTLTLTNCGAGTAGCSKASNQTLGSANYAIPAPYVGQVTPGAASLSGWHVTVSTDGGTLQFRSDGSKDALLPGASVSVLLTITAPSSVGAAFCSSGDDWVWHSRVKQSNDFSGNGNDYALAGGQPDASLTAAKLVFATAGSPPSQVVQGATFSAKVTAEDLCGHALPSAVGTSVSLSLTGNPPGANLSGASLPSQTIDSSGVATFNGLSIDAVGNLLTLSASADNFATGTSDTIAVVNVLCGPHDHSCSQTTLDNFVTATADIPDHGQVGIGFTGANGYVSGFQCGTSTSPIDSQLVLIDPSPDAYDGNYSVTLLYDKSVSGTGPASSFPVCISDDGVNWPSPPNPLQACTSTPAPCITSEKRTSNGALQIVLLLAPGDPFGGGGR